MRIFPFAVRLGLTLALTLGLASGSHGAELEKDVIKQAFAEGQLALRPEASHFTIDPQTYNDLELGALTELIQAYAPSQMARERIAWLLAHPYLDPDEIQKRQDAIAAIAGDDEIFESLASMFEPNRMEENQTSRGKLAALTKRYLLGHQHLTRHDFIRQFSSGKIMSLTTFSHLISVGWIAYAQYLTVLAGLHMVKEPGFWSILSVPFNTIFLMMICAGDNTHLPLLAATERGSQASRLANMDPAAFEGSQELQEVQEFCQQNKSCLNTIGRLGWLHPFRGKWGVVAKVLGVSRILSIPSRFYFVRRRDVAIRIVAALTEVETLYAFAKMYREYQGSMIFPKLLRQQTASLSIEHGHHPYLYLHEGASDPMSIHFDQVWGPRGAIITGPNSAGKTTVEQTFLTNSVLGMTGAPVFARGMSFTPAHVITNFTTNTGSLRDAKSTFRSQARRAIHMLKLAEAHTPVLTAMDEILTGTSSHEHRALERAALIQLMAKPETLFTLATHERSLTKHVGSWPGVVNLQVSLTGHKLLEGASTVYNAIDILAEEGASPEFLAEARRQLQIVLAEDSCERILAPGNGTQNF